MRKENVLLLAILLILLSASAMQTNTEEMYPETSIQSGVENTEKFHSNPRSISSYSDTKTGYLDPLTVERFGWTTSGSISARTDTDSNLVYNLPLDESHNWVGSKVGVNIDNLSRHYAVNGTFEDGIVDTNVNPTGEVESYPYGWMPSFVSTDERQTQRSAYVGSGRKYVTAENEGDYGTQGHPKEYSHFAGTAIMWNQNITRIPYTEQFYFSFDYQYFRGPLEAAGGGNASLFLAINGTRVWNMSLDTINERGTWYSTQKIPIQISEPGDIFVFTIGLSIDNTMYLDPEIHGGLENTAYITLFLDDVKFIAQDPIGLNQVDLSMTVDNTTVHFDTQSDSGYAEITNAEYWTAGPVTTVLEANTSIGFVYVARLLSHNFVNSSWTTSEDQTGIEYEVDFNQPLYLELYTYLGFLGDYENLRIRATHPHDWANPTIYDPFGANVTDLCVLGEDYFQISSSLTSRLGWWRINLDAPNYLNSSIIQVYDQANELWINLTQIRSSNLTRATVSIGTTSDVATDANPVNMTWISPEGATWFSESLSGDSSGEVNGSGLIFGPDNTTAGEWYTLIEWTNGTHVAHGGSTFGVYHQSELAALDDIIDTEAGLTVRARVQFRDSENGDYLIGSSANVIANWTSGIIEFQPNAVNNWWEYELDTSGLTGGNYTLVVNASLAYFDNSSTSLVLRVIRTDNTLTLKQDVAELDLGEPFVAILHYQDSLDVDIEGAQLSVRFSGPSEGINWSSPVDQGSGNYTIDFSTFLSGSYTVTITAKADFYEAAEDALFIYVGEIGTELTIINGSTGAIDYGEDYRIVVEYQNITGYSLDGATVSVASISPETGLEVTEINALGDGFYEILFSSSKADTYTLLIAANLTNHKTQFKSFTLLVSEISTVLTLVASDDVITIDESCFIELTLLNSTGDGVEGASVTIIDPPDGLVISDTTDLSGGSYFITISSNQTGTYQLVFRASHMNHIDSTSSLTLSVVLVPTRIYTGNQELDPVVEYGDSWTLRFYYEGLDRNGQAYANISGADILVEVISGSESSMGMTITECEECFYLEVWTKETGIWDIRVLANRTGFLEADADIKLTVIQTQTAINSIDDFECYVQNPVAFLVNYSYASNGTVVPDAEPRASGTGSGWVTMQKLASGLYNVTLIAEETGSYSIELVFSSEGHEPQSVSLDFTASLRPLSIVVDTIIWRQGTNLVLTVTTTDSEDGTAISDAHVEYVLIQDGSEVLSGTLDYSEAGTYSATIPVNWRETDDLQVEFTVRKQFYESTSTTVNIVTQPDIAAFLSEAAMTVIPIGLAAVVVLSLVAAAYNRYQKRQMEHLQETRKVKRRFDDAANLLGMIVLHKSSGLPVYSKILKSGLEEGMVSAFITAITHFRSEFEMSEHSVEGRAIPISDVIRAVPTKNLICAFITITSPSRAQEIRMEAFSAAIAEGYDELLGETPKEYRDHGIANEMDQLFEKFMDGSLLRKYTLRETAEIGDKYKPVVNHAQELNGEESFSLYQLAQLVMDDGILEAEAYYRILDVVNEGVLVPESSPREATYFNDVD
ncbi:carboxypeptidase regulatory-like domain-containing protein [Candidatus Thorarchaeota archaeon]|nr:MAG: carboxypeptidase regulatory-like domain-containing protein [Candidatus Thorarchaeota archaeon]